MSWFRDRLDPVKVWTLAPPSTSTSVTPPSLEPGLQDAGDQPDTWPLLVRDEVSVVPALEGEVSDHVGLWVAYGAIVCFVIAVVCGFR